VLAEKHPRIYNQTRALAEQRVAAKRGPLPGDDKENP
jgi:hypothetical protein